MKDWNLEYYIMPDEYMCFDKHMKQIRNINLEGWKMVQIGPHSDDSCTRHSAFFVEDIEFMKQFLWEMKAEDEELVVCVCESWRKNIFRENSITEIKDLGEEIPECFGGKGAFLYKVGNEIKKYIYINPGETLECYCKEECLDGVVTVVSRIATITDYHKYELGE